MVDSESSLSLFISLIMAIMADRHRSPIRPLLSTMDVTIIWTDGRRNARVLPWLIEGSARISQADLSRQEQIVYFPVKKSLVTKTLQIFYHNFESIRYVTVLQKCPLFRSRPIIWLMQKSCRFNISVTMTPIKRRKRQKFVYGIFACKISCYHYYVITFWHSVMMTGNFTCENTINEFLPFSTFNWCHRYTSVKNSFYRISSKTDYISPKYSRYDVKRWTLTCITWPCRKRKTPILFIC